MNGLTEQIFSLEVCAMPSDNHSMVTITVQNKQGATEQYTGKSVAECKRWLRNTWSDPKNLSYVMRDSDGRVLAEKGR